jgi:hypothetical protein
MFYERAFVTSLTPALCSWRFNSIDITLPARAFFYVIPWADQFCRTLNFFLRKF